MIFGIVFTLQDTHIIDEDTFNRVQELRKSRRKNAATGRTSLFSGLAYCADCGSKIYFFASKSVKEKNKFFRCSAYKENRGNCTMHYIRNVVLKEIVLQTILKVAEYISQYEPVFLYLYNKQHKLNQAKELSEAKQNLAKSKKRIDELDMLLERIYEDNVFGKISDERVARMSANYET